jgi:hypothetical protein
MTNQIPAPLHHAAGEQSAVEHNSLPPGVDLDSFSGPVHVEWEKEA